MTHVELVPEVLQSRLQYSALRVHEGDAHHHHTPPVMVVEIHPLRHLAPRNGKQDGAPAPVTGLEKVKRC